MSKLVYRLCHSKFFFWRLRSIPNFICLVISSSFIFYNPAAWLCLRGCDVSVPADDVEASGLCRLWLQRWCRLSVVHTQLSSISFQALSTVKNWLRLLSINSSSNQRQWLTSIKEIWIYILLLQPQKLVSIKSTFLNTTLKCSSLSFCDEETALTRRPRNTQFFLFVEYHEGYCERCNLFHADYSSYEVKFWSGMKLHQRQFK